MDSDTGDEPHIISNIGLLQPSLGTSGVDYGPGVDYAATPSSFSFSMDPVGAFAGAQGVVRPQTTPSGVPILYAQNRDLGGSPNLSNLWGPGFGMDFSNFGQGITNVGAMNYGAGFSPGASWLQPKKPEPPPETGPLGGTLGPRIKAAIKNKLENFKDPKKRQAWFKRFFGNLLRFHPQTRLPTLAIDAFKAFQEGGAGGIMGALGQMGMQKVFGKNLDVAQGIFGVASGGMTPGQALGRVTMSRGMRAGIQGLMKNIYGQFGMRGVQIAMPLLQTALQARGKGPGGP